MAINIKDYIDDSYNLFINNEFVPSATGEQIEVYNPATGALLSKVAKADTSDVDKAVDAAKNAFESWSRTSNTERAEYLKQIGDKILENKDRFATIETLNNGKPIRETSAIDVPNAARHFKYFGSVIETDEGTVNDLDENTMSIVRHEPIGVVGAVVAWNFPLLLASWKLAPAIAAGIP